MGNRLEESLSETIRSSGGRACPPAVESSHMTIMGVFSRLENKCVQLEELADLTEKLNMRLYGEYEDNDRKGDPIVGTIKNAPLSIIPELFDMLAERIEMQMERIGVFTSRSIDIVG